MSRTEARLFCWEERALTTALIPPHTNEIYASFFFLIPFTSQKELNESYHKKLEENRAQADEKTAKKRAKRLEHIFFFNFAAPAGLSMQSEQNNI